MSAIAPIQSFRGLRALLLQAEDQSRAVLERTLHRLGLEVETLDPAETEAIPEARITASDIMFVDADAGALPSWSGAAPPIVAVIGHETPSRLLRVVEMQASGFLLKPVRAQGVFTSVFLAVNGHRRTQALCQRLEEMEHRHAARRHVIRAVVSIMERTGAGEDEAFRMLRRESMARRVTIEELSRQYAEASGVEPRRHVGGQ